MAKSSNLSVRYRNLQQILYSKYLPNESVNPVFDSSELQNHAFGQYLQQAYEALGGTVDFPFFKSKPQFMEFGRFCVVFDETRHFNRYRAKTLRVPFYDSLASFPLMKYRSYCRKYEVECLKSATGPGAWTNARSEALFGPGQQSGDLGLRGAPGWKLTALTDVAVDMIARKRKIRLVRIGVWDDLMVNKRLMKLNQLLISPDKSTFEAIINFIDRKVVGLYADDF